MNVGVGVRYQPFEPFGVGGLNEIVVTGVVLSIVIVFAPEVPVLPAVWPGWQ